MQSGELTKAAAGYERSRPVRGKGHLTPTAEMRDMLMTASAKLPSSLSEAASLADAVLRSTQILRDLSLRGEAALLRAECHSKQGELARANELITEALDAFERSGKRSHLGRAYKLQATVFSQQERVSLALAAASRSLRYPDLPPKERARLYSVIGVSLSRLFDVPTGLAAAEQRSLPEAIRSGDPETIVACHLRTAAAAIACAFWSKGIPHYLTVGMARPEGIVGAAEYLQRAMRYVLIAEAHQAQASPPEQAYFFGMKGHLVALRDGFDSAQPIFALGHALAADRVPGLKLALLLCEATSARVAERWQHALDLLAAVQQLPTAHVYQRVIYFEQACIYRALGRADEALQALEAFTQLHTNMSRLASNWIDDASSRRRYGEQLELSRLRSSVLDLIEPPALKRAVRYVEKNLDRRLPLSEVARHAGVSVRTLHSLYKDFRGISASAFIKERRMQRAHDMLSNGRVSVFQVTDAIGYSNPANFARDFRRRFGWTPSDIQRRSDQVTNSSAA